MHKATTFAPWHPDRPVSKGATAYHDAIINASWHIENVDELIRIAQEKIKDNDVVVDFGAGTGGSAFYFSKKIKTKFNLWLVDNSAAWLGKAYEILGNNSNVKFFLLGKDGGRYLTLADTVGEGVADHVVSANTFHLIPDLEGAFRGINAALKNGGSFAFQSGNIMRKGRKKGVLMIDDTIKRVHEIAIDLIQANSKFNDYWGLLDEKVKKEEEQRKFVFPEPRPVEFYINELNAAGFRHEKVSYKLIKVKYSDWLNFLRVKRLQAGILPEIGGKEPSPKEERDRDDLIKMASMQLFKELENSNPLADKERFTAEWVYIASTKER